MEYKLQELVSMYMETYQPVFGYRLGQPPPLEWDVGPEKLAGLLREVGVPVQAYRLVKAQELGFPHLRWDEERWEAHLPPLLPSSTPVGARIVVGEPPTGVWFRVCDRSEQPKPEEPDVVIAYAATADLPEVDPQIFVELEAYIRSARESGRPVVYLDSVGLIPEDRVRQMNPQDERAGFRLTYELIAREAQQIGAGHPPFEPRSPFWKALYELLAKQRVETRLEALTYELWREIVEFDHRNLLQQVVHEFLSGFPKEAAKTSLEYAQRFHELNCVARARLLVDQVDGLMSSSGPRPLILIVRELGHYGVLEGMLAGEYMVHSRIAGKDRFTLLLGTPWLGEGLLHNLGVKMAEEEQLLWAARACLKRILLMELKGKGFREIIRFFAASGIDGLGWDDLEEILQDLYHPALIMQRKHGLSIAVQLMALLASRGVISEAGVVAGEKGGNNGTE